MDKEGFRAKMNADIEEINQRINEMQGYQRQLVGKLDELIQAVVLHLDANTEAINLLDRRMANTLNSVLDRTEEDIRQMMADPNGSHT